MKTLKLRGVKWLVQGHPAGKDETTMQNSEPPLCSALNNKSDMPNLARCSNCSFAAGTRMMPGISDALLRESEFRRVSVLCRMQSDPRHSPVLSAIPPLPSPSLSPSVLWRPRAFNRWNWFRFGVLPPPYIVVLTNNAVFIDPAIL